MANRKRYELLVENFDKLPTQCKELFFRALFVDYTDGIPFGEFLNAYDLDYSYCESPIEIMLGMALDIVGFTTPIYNKVCCESQTEIVAENGKKYRADFLVFINNKKNALIVECDGHEFHEKTKEQVNYRNQRDYDLKASGYDILHYSGSRIYANPFTVACEIFNYVLAKGNK